MLQMKLRTFYTDQDCWILHSDAGCRGPQGSAHSMVVLETDFGLSCRRSSKALGDAKLYTVLL